MSKKLDSQRATERVNDEEFKESLPNEICDPEDIAAKYAFFEEPSQEVNFQVLRGIHAEEEKSPRLPTDFDCPDDLVTKKVANFEFKRPTTPSKLKVDP